VLFLFHIQGDNKATVAAAGALHRIPMPYVRGPISGAALGNFLTPHAQLSKLSNQSMWGQEPAPVEGKAMAVGAAAVVAEAVVAV